MDLRDNTSPTFANGSYSTELFADKVINIVKNHDGDKVSCFEVLLQLYKEYWPEIKKELYLINH